MRLRASLGAALVLAVTTLLSSFALAEIRLFQDFDSGSLNVPASSIIAAIPASPVISLAPRYTFSNQWWWVHFQASGLLGTTPQFTLPTANAFQSVSAANRYVYSYDGQNWSFFNQASVSSGLYRFSNTSAFTQDSVFVAVAMPYPVARTAAHISSLKSSPFVQPTPSASSELTLGFTPGTAGGGYTDDLGRAVESQPLYAYRITDPAVAGAKAKVVLLGGNHCGETTGTWTLQGMVDFLVSADPAAAELRQRADFYVYPLSDPEGRAAGYFRSNPQNPAANHNRVWDQPSAFTDINTIRNAMIADTGGQADVFLDFHSFGSATDIGYYNHSTHRASQTFLSALHGLEPAVKDITIPITDGTSVTVWAATGLGAKVSVTPEMGFLANQPVQRYSQIGENYGRALLATILSGVLEPPRPRSSTVFYQQTAALQPVMHLRLNEAGGMIAADSSAAGNHPGTYVGTVKRGMADPFDADSLAGAVRAGGDASPGHVRVADFNYTGANNHFSLAFWLNTADITGAGSQYVFSHGTVATVNSLNVYLVELDNSGQGNRLRTVIADSNDAAGFTNMLDIQPAGADGSWHLYTLVVDSTGSHVYYDASLIGSSTNGGSAFNPAGDIFIAGRADLAADRFYGAVGEGNGLFDEVMLFNRALTGDEITSMYQSVPEPSVLGLVALAGVTLARPRRRR